MTSPLQLRQRQQLANNAQLYGKRGGASKSPKKLEAITINRARAHLASRIKQAERGTLFKVVGTDFMGNDRACRHFIKTNGLKGVEIIPVSVRELS